MKKILKHFASAMMLLVVCCFYTQMIASHLAGADLTYRYLGNVSFG
jgi:hypothetical protein